MRGANLRLYGIKDVSMPTLLSMGRFRQPNRSLLHHSLVLFEELKATSPQPKGSCDISA